MLAHDETLRLWVALAGFLHGEAQLKTWTHPRDVNHFVTVDFLGHLNAAGGSGNGNRRVRMRVIDMRVRDETV